MIGTFGDVVFVASSEKIRTFDEFSRETAARWAIHEVHLRHPVPEYIGPGQDTINFTMYFDVRYGMNPRIELDRLLVMARSGTAATLTIGGSALGVSKWYIESVPQHYDYFDNRGKLLVGRAVVTLKEYV